MSNSNIDDKLPPWCPVPKKILRQLLDDRAPSKKYTKAEAYISLILDADEINEVSYSGYKKLWGWGFKRIENYLSKLGICMRKINPEQQKSLSILAPANRTATGLQPDCERTANGLVKFFIFGGLWAESDRKRTANGLQMDCERDASTDTDTDTDKKDKEEPSSPSNNQEDQNPCDQGGGLPLPGGARKEARGTNNLSRGLLDQESSYCEYSQGEDHGDEDIKKRALITSLLAGRLAWLAERGLKFTPTRAEKQSPGAMIIEWGEMFFDQLNQLEIDIDDIENLQKALERAFSDMGKEDCWPTIKDAVPHLRKELYKINKHKQVVDESKSSGVTPTAACCIQNFWGKYKRGYKSEQTKH